jgi:hypothetical protein
MLKRLCSYENTCRTWDGILYLCTRGAGWPFWLHFVVSIIYTTSCFGQCTTRNSSNVFADNWEWKSTEFYANTALPYWSETLSLATGERRKRRQNETRAKRKQAHTTPDECNKTIIFTKRSCIHSYFFFRVHVYEMELNRYILKILHNYTSKKIVKVDSIFLNRITNFNMWPV